MTRFLVIDTEGKPLLTEIAIINDRGEVIYEKRVNQRHKLSQILLEVYNICHRQTIVFHYAGHDRGVLATSYSWENISIPRYEGVCTWEMAKKLLPDLPNYSLEYLSKHLNLKVNKRRFSPHLAHSARYDALFTFQLYSYLCAMTTNPFDNIYVDNPFQRHADLGMVYADQFNLLSQLIKEVRSNLNHQSLGLAVLGEAGSGKSHLMMRLAQTHLRTNRLLFVSQPNNAESVFYHIYCCVLESLFQSVLDGQYTQLEYLIANTFVRIVQASEKSNRSVAGQKIIADFSQDPLSMYVRMAKVGTEKHRTTWEYIERQTLSWWSQAYGAGGYGLSILKGIVKFCRYRDPNKRENVRRWLAGQSLAEEELRAISLDNWEEELSRENFALQALKVLGRLSVLDEPLIFVFDQLEGLWLTQHQSLLLSFGHTVKELITHVPNSLVILNLFPDRWQEFNRSFDPSVTDRISYQVRLERPSDEQLWQILQLRAQGLNLKELFNENERSEILRQPSIRSVIKRASQYFRHKVQKLPLPSLEQVFEPVGASLSLEERVTKLEQLVETLQHRSVELPEPNIEELFEIDEQPTIEPEESIVLTDPSLDEEIKSYIKDLEQRLDREYNRSTILSETDDVGKLATIAEVFSGSFTISTLPRRRQSIPENILLHWPTKSYAIGFLYGSPNRFANAIRMWNLLLPDMPDTRFLLIRDDREPKIRETAIVGTREIAKLNQSDNGKFHIMEKPDRVNFELCYKLVLAVQNRDLEAPMAKVMDVLVNCIPSYWLIQILSG